ncbi:MAG: hypothetical protein IPJ81_12790 [Chitinophagaceae bacterium]|nr:hypothetical protein [Chitinophagaceae bacterium]
MVIAVDASFLLQKHLKNYNNFIIECFNRLANNYPQHQFIYIYPKAIFQHSFEVKKNTFPLVISSSFSWHLSKYWWYTIKLPAVIKKHKADVLVSVYKQGVKNDKFSKCLIANDFFSKKEIVKDLKNADSVATSSVSIKTKVVNTYAIDEKKITVIYYAVSPLFKPVDWEEKELAKNKYASSIDYFLCLASFCTHENLITVLKAFSKFKQWQKKQHATNFV